MIKLLVLTFLYMIGSALVPVLNAEAYVAAVAAKVHSIPLWEIAVIAGVGQTVGKLIWYYVGSKSLDWPYIKKKMEKPSWQASYEKWNARIAGRPLMGGLVTFVSAVTGFPPLAVIAVLAGTMRVHLPIFTITCALGRSLRFWLILAGVATAFT